MGDEVYENTVQFAGFYKETEDGSVTITKDYDLLMGFGDVMEYVKYSVEFGVKRQYICCC